MIARITPQQIKAIHIAKSRAGLDEADYRAVLGRFGVTTSKALTRDAAEQLIEALPGTSRSIESQGLTRSAVATGPYAPKLRALWIAGWNLGIVRDRTDAAIHTFVQRQTGLDHTRFLRDHKAAAKAIEALKAWLARDAGVVWPKAGSDREAPPLELRRAVLRAQCRIGTQVGLDLACWDRLFEEPALPSIDLDAASRAIGRKIRAAQTRQARAA